MTPVTAGAVVGLESVESRCVSHRGRRSLIGRVGRRVEHHHVRETGTSRRLVYPERSPYSNAESSPPFHHRFAVGTAAPPDSAPPGGATHGRPEGGRRSFGRPGPVIEVPPELGTDLAVRLVSSRHPVRGDGRAEGAEVVRGHSDARTHHRASAYVSERVRAPRVTPARGLVGDVPPASTAARTRAVAGASVDRHRWT